MDTKQNNFFINEFKGGMNSDLSYDVLLPNLYVFGENIRITTNALISEINNSNTKEGSLNPIPHGVNINTNSNTKIKDILAADSIGNIGVIITRDINDKWSIFRVNKDEDGIACKKIFTSANTVGHKNKFSIVLNKEINDDIILYIADGERLIMSVNINDDDYNSKITNENQFISEFYFPLRKLHISEVIIGQLKTGLVLYTYRFYKRRGIKSKLAPLTNKFQIVDQLKNFESGNAENTITGIGLKLSLVVDDICLKTFDKVLVYRLYYTKSNVNSDIELIYDDYIENRNVININDTGILALETYSIDEFGTLDGLQLIPQSIELNLNYMFAANVNDITKLKLDDYAFDARSYSMNSQRQIQLYNLNDIRYEGFPHTIYYDENSTTEILKDIDVNISLNKYADINLNVVDDIDYCRLDDKMYYGGIGPNISWRFVTTPIQLHTQNQIDNNLPPKDLDSGNQYLYYLKHKDEGGGTYSIELESSNKQAKTVFQQNDVCDDITMSYEHPLTSSMFRSLKRDETYRYGIILYDNQGRKSDVLWIADIKTPSIKKFPTSNYNMSASSAPGTQTYNISQDVIGYGQELEFDEQIQYQIDLSSEFGNPSIYLSQPIGYSTTVWKSAIKHLKKGQKIKLIILNDSTFSFTGMYYNWCHEGVVNPSGIVVFPPFSVQGEAMAQQAVHNIENIDLGEIGNRITDISVTASTLLKINGGSEKGGVTITPYAQDYYEVQYDCEAQIEHYIGMTYIRTEDNYIEYLKLHPTSIDTGPVGSSNIKLRLEVLNPIEDSDFEDTPLEEAKVLDGLIAYPLGIEFNVHDLPSDIAAYQIVRCEKPTVYTKNIIQCAAARPIRQKLSSKKDGITRYSPYYPHYILNALPYGIVTSQLTYSNVNVSFDSTTIPNADAVTDMSSKEERNVFLLYSPEITLARNTTLSKINKDCNIDFLQYCYEDPNPVVNSQLINDKFIGYTRQDLNKLIDSGSILPTSYDKSSCDFVSFYYNNGTIESTGDDCTFKLNGIADVLNPNWESGFGNVQIGTGKIGDTLTTGVITFASKSYKSYLSVINDKEYLNWHCTGMYNLKAYHGDADYGQSDSKACMLVENITDPNTNQPLTRHAIATGLVGPGPVCYVASVDDKPSSPIYGLMPIKIDNNIAGTSCAYVCNITHKANQFSGYTKEDKKYDIYYGFGNFIKKDSGSDTYTVFDGDTYITPFEIVQMYKAFDFNDRDTLPSGLFVYYIALESSINNYFNYGYNFSNTKSKTLQITPGEIVGVATQERPSNQYNLIYSDNNVSNDIYNSDTNEDDIDLISQRIYYSQQKISGENIDVYTYFKPLDYIDVDTRYGELTHIFSNRDILYCWQDLAFGKVHVNEKSLVSDNNGNMIQLGTGGVMQRIDYIDSHYGMSKYQHVSVGVEDKVYWIDDKNKAILVSDGQRAMNLSEQTNVQNIVNERFKQGCPTIHYDLQNQELLCKCLNDDQMIFNTKLNVATSLYTRRYLDIITLNNTLYGIDENLNFIQYNNLNKSYYLKYMPTTIKFVINKDASTTKVYDNQELVMAGEYTDNLDLNRFMNNKRFSFSTNIYPKTVSNVDYSTREGNVEYVIPRLDGAIYGNRYRGKWMCVEIKDKTNSTNFAISHIITKFRQSFS